MQSLASELESTFAVAFDDDAYVLTTQASHDLALPLLKERLAAQGVHLDLQYRGSLDALAAQPGYTLAVPGAVVALTRALPWYR